MDAEGARVLARRIEEQQAREAKVAPFMPAAPKEPLGRTVVLTPIEGPPALGRETSPRTTPGVEIVRGPRAAAAGARDIRMYSRSSETAMVNGRPVLVTTVRCRTLVDGEWQSRGVRVEVEQADSSG